MSRDLLHEELGPKKAILLGLLSVTLIVGGVVFGLVAYRQVSQPRPPRQADVTPATPAGNPRAVRSGRSSAHGSQGVSPLSDPDGGWPAAPKSLDQMNLVPDGTLQRGSLGNESEEDETPATTVRLPAFYLDRYEVTNAQYAACVQAGVCRPPLELDRSRFGGPRQPVVGVDWFDATAYCRWSGKRLPTEAEWERAARGSERQLYPWGNGRPNCSQAIFALCDRYGPAEIGGRPEGAGPYGNQDLAGNVWEWVQDWYAPRYYSSDTETNPTGPPAGRQRVLRGGSWHFGTRYIRAANRHRDHPAHRTAWYGFRCAFRPPPPPPPPPPPLPAADAGPERNESARSTSPPPVEIKNLHQAGLPHW
jgi:formylglycine-generating enzyme required for sulfatase activity